MPKPNGSALPYINAALFARPELTEDLANQISHARDAVSQAFADIINAAADQFDDLAVQQWFVQDATLFCVFLGSILTVERSGGEVEKRQLLSALNHLAKRIEREIPEQILMFARGVVERQGGAL